MTFYQPITPPAVQQVCVWISFLNEKPKAQNRAKSSLHTTGNQCSVWASKSCFCDTSPMTHTVILSEPLKQPALTELTALVGSHGGGFWKQAGQVLRTCFGRTARKRSSSCWSRLQSPHPARREETTQKHSYQDCKRSSWWSLQVD